jgi:16S rRNA (uracil1498-N3)-methyltransferase
MTRPPVRLHVDVPVLASGLAFALPLESSHYVANVMRGRPGDRLELFNGRHGAWTAEITAADKKATKVCLIDQSAPQEVPDDIWLCAAPLKKGRIDWLAEKACELGIAALQPVLTRRTIVDKLNSSRLTAHMREAAEQCGRTFIPPIHAALPLARLLETWPAGRTLIFCDENGGATLVDTVRPLAGLPLALLIGPEGGFEDSERDMIRGHANARAVTLGPRILRADTAAVAALSVIQATIGKRQLDAGAEALPGI